MKKRGKKTIILPVLLIIAGIWFYMALAIMKRSRQEASYVQTPEIALTSINNEKTFLTNYDSEKYLLFIYFNTHCDFCKFELRELEKNMAEFGNTEIFLVSAEPLDNLKRFNSQHSLNIYPNAGIYHCPYNMLEKHFGKLASPTIIIYNPDRELIKRFRGSTRITDILKAINHEETGKPPPAYQ